MAGIFDATRLRRENSRLKAENAHLKADNLDLQHENAALKEDNAQLKQFALELGGTGQTINENLHCLLEQVQSLGASQERNFKLVSEDLSQLNTSLDEVESAVGNLTTTVSTETQQVIAELERLNNQHPQIDLGPAISRLQGVKGAVDTASTNISNIIADAAPTPEPGPEPAPGSRRK